MCSKILILQFPRKDGRRSLKGADIKRPKAFRKIGGHDDAATHCGAHTAACPTGIRWGRGPERAVMFTPEKGRLCESGETACLVRALQVLPTNQVLLI